MADTAADTLVVRRRPLTRDQARWINAAARRAPVIVTTGSRRALATLICWHTGQKSASARVEFPGGRRYTVPKASIELAETDPA